MTSARFVTPDRQSPYKGNQGMEHQLLIEHNLRRGARDGFVAQPPSAVIEHQVTAGGAAVLH